MEKKEELPVEELLKELTLEEKVALVSGHDFMCTFPIPRLGIPSVRMSDGPHGLRVAAEAGRGAKPATCFPTASCSANSFNPSLLERMGTAMAEEAKYYGIDVILGPGVNIKRNPLCGRNFEYFSEDPVLAGRLGAAMVKGIQGQGIGTSLKHFALNNGENYRFVGDYIADERAMREIYLRQFEYIVKEARPETVMSGYNQANGVFCSENRYLLEKVLRKEWGYEGLAVSDWGGVRNRVESIKAGQDLEMPGNVAICRKWLYDAVKDGSLEEKDLDKAVANVLALVNQHFHKEKLDSVEWEEHHKLAKEIALQGAVLLKNDGMLPLNQEEPLLIIGSLFEKTRYQGSGSSMIHPALLSTPKEVFDANGISYRYAKGYELGSGEADASLLEEAVKAAESHSKVVLFLGLIDGMESEGVDRDSMSLPRNQLALVDALIKAKKEIVVVLYGGSVVELPFFDEVKGMLNMFLPGQNGGEATYELLFGLVSPSGRLAETWPIRYENVPFGESYSKERQEIYKESIYVGYRYYESANKAVRFPFGYGLSYASFEYSSLDAKENKDAISVKVGVTNTGSIPAYETVQVYISSPKECAFKPLRELKGFTKVYLEPGQTKEAEIKLRMEDLRFWAIKEGRFVLEEGEYAIEIGKNSRDIVLSTKLFLKGEKLAPQYSEETERIYRQIDLDKMSNEVFEDMAGFRIPKMPKKKPITLESRFSDLKSTLPGKFIYRRALRFTRIDLKNAKKLPPGVDRDNRIKDAVFGKRIMNSNSLRTFLMCSGGGVSYSLVCGYRELANWHFVKAIKAFRKKDEAPALPSEDKKQ